MNDRASSGFLDAVVDRTIGRLRSAWRDIAGPGRAGRAGPTNGPELSSDDVERVRDQLHACLEGRGGEVAARARAAELGRTYLALNADGRERFLHLLADEFDVDHGAVAAAASRVLQASSHRDKEAAEAALRAGLGAPRVQLLTQFNALPEGVKFLVDMRAELMGLARTDRVLAGLERDLKALLRGWFDIGFLELKRITWNSPAALLEKLMAYEAVHEIRSWTDLKNRLEADRRCFAFFHPRMPDEPLIFVEVALVKGMADNVHALLDESAPLGDPRAADTAIFYSISNCQRGLAGISFGNFLIKRVAWPPARCGPPPPRRARRAWRRRGAPPGRERRARRAPAGTRASRTRASRARANRKRRGTQARSRSACTPAVAPAIPRVTMRDRKAIPLEDTHACLPGETRWTADSVNRGRRSPARRCASHGPDSRLALPSLLPVDECSFQMRFAVWSRA